MKLTYDKAKHLFYENRVQELADNPRGLRFLKLRSLSRPEFLRRLLAESGIPAPGFTGDKLLRFVCGARVSCEQIETAIRAIYAEKRKERKRHERELVSELYKLRVFDWGGLHQNSLEKTIINNYVKKIRSFDALNACIEKDLHDSMRGYVLCSWYNHWSSILIEDIFRDHPAVLPAVGMIPKVDFFIEGVPFDLKVTPLPEGYVSTMREKMGLPPEINLLRKFCRDNEVHFDTQMAAGRLLEDLWAKVSDHPSVQGRTLIHSLQEARALIIAGIQEDPVPVMRWLYENQGVRRFDWSNRLYLVLANCADYFGSWKLKRARELLVSRIHANLDRIAAHPGHRVRFNWDGEKYTATAELILIAHGTVPELKRLARGKCDCSL